MNETNLLLNALSIIHTVTNLTEFILISNKSAAHAGLQLSSYLRPQFLIHDHGQEFIGEGFQVVLHRHHIHNHLTTVKNPQVNAICERLHQTVTSTSITSYSSSAGPRQ